MLSGLSAIALNTFRETVRDRVLYAFVVFAFLFTLAGIILGSLSIGQNDRILQDLGLAVISMIGGIIAIFLGTNLVYKEIDRRTIYLILTKPIARWQFVLGKYLGLSFCLFVVTGLMGLFLIGLLAVYAADAHALASVAEAVGLIYLELLFVIAVATFFSTFATPLMSVLFTLAIWLIGHMSQALLELAKLSQGSTSGAACIPCCTKLGQIMYWVVPDLAKLTQVRYELISFRPVDCEILFYLITYILAYIVFLLLLSTLVTEQREFS